MNLFVLPSYITTIDYNLSNLDFKISAADGEEPETFKHRDAVIKLLTELSKYYREKDTLWKQIVYFSSLLFLFYITGTFWFIFCTFNVMMILPSVVFSPAVFNKV